MSTDVPGLDQPIIGAMEVSSESGIPAEKTVASVSDGVVEGAPRRWLKAEGATLLAGSLLALSTTHEPWWLVPLLILLPDAFAVGYLVGPAAGARAYNLAHVTLFPGAVVAFGWWHHEHIVMALGLIWLAHIGVDRLVGYGLKYGDNPQHTHLGRKSARK